MKEMALRVQGGTPLYGQIQVQRAKNAILAMIAASIVVEDGETVLHDVPAIEDVERAFELLRAVGARVDHDRAAKTVRIDASDIRSGILPAEIASQFRGSVLFLAPLQVRLAMLNCRAAGAVISARERSTSTTAGSPGSAPMCSITMTDAPLSIWRTIVSRERSSTWICPAIPVRKI